MQISKLSVTVCAAVLCGTLAGLHAADETPAQAAAIAGLRQKIQQADGTATPTTPAPIVVDGKGLVSPRDAAADAAQAKAIAEVQEKAKQQAFALEQKQAELTEKQAKAAAEAAAKAEAARAKALAAEQARQAAEAKAAAQAEAARVAAAQKQAAREAAQAKLAADAAAKKIALANAAAQKAAAEKVAAEKLAAEKAAQAQAQAAADKAKAAQAAADAVYFPGKELGFKPIQTPALPISADKQAKLDALLAKYQADKVSPEEYHKQRADILAQP